MHHLTSIDHLYYVQHHSNPFVKFGCKCFSQTDEDGLTLEIINRIKPSNKYYLELGVGDGMECNSLVLDAIGWRGQWIGNQDLVVKHYNYTKSFITKNNIINLINVNPFLVSIDLDGNDYHILKEIVSILSPDIIITEYNAKFPPPVVWIMPYLEEYVWNSSDFFGASLQAFINLLDGYKLIVCNAATGANAFFVKQKYAELFWEIPYKPIDIYVPPRYRVDVTYGQHLQDVSTAQLCLNKL